MTRKQRNRKTSKKWRRLVSEQAASGQTVSVFCRECGLGRQSFFAWRKRLGQAEPKKFVEMKVATVTAEPARGHAALESAVSTSVRGFGLVRISAILIARIPDILSVRGDSWFHSALFPMSGVSVILENQQH
jgi:hypothetical protein